MEACAADGHQRCMAGREAEAEVDRLRPRRWERSVHGAEGEQRLPLRLGGAGQAGDVHALVAPLSRSVRKQVPSRVSHALMVPSNGPPLTASRPSRVTATP